MIVNLKQISMKRFFTVALVVSCVACFVIGCGDDEDPVAGISFEKTSEETSESNGELTSFHPDLLADGVGKDISVKVKLDKPAPSRIVLSYSVGGTALKRNNLSQDQYSDFALNGTSAKDTENLIIEAGAMEATITLTIYEDFEFEVDDDSNLFETVILMLTEVVSGPGFIAEADNRYELNITEDDLLVFLLWDTNPTTTSVFEREGADLDLFAWLEGDVVNSSTAAGQEIEALFIPGGFPDGTYGFSYTYYEGTADAIDIYPSFFGNISGQFFAFPEEAVIRTARYTLANINKYDEEDAPSPAIVQTISKNKTSFGAPSEIAVPATGSRTETLLKPLPVKGNVSNFNTIRQLIRKVK